MLKEGSDKFRIPNSYIWMKGEENYWTMDKEQFKYTSSHIFLNNNYIYFKFVVVYLYVILNIPELIKRFF